MNDPIADLEARLAQLERQMQFMDSAEAVKRGGGDVVPLTTDDAQEMDPEANHYLNRIVRGTPDKAEIALRDGDGVWRWEQYAPQPDPPPPPNIFDLWPIGVPMAWFLELDDIPEGFQLCDGTNGTPDMRGRFPVGAGGAYDLGDTGGADAVTLTLTQIPSHTHDQGTLTNSVAGAHNHPGSTALTTNSNHTHSGTAASNGLHRHGYTSPVNTSFGGLGSTTQVTTTGASNTDYDGAHEHSVSIPSSGSHQHTLNISTESNHTHVITGSTGSSGSGQSHENRPPFYAWYWIAKPVTP